MHIHDSNVPLDPAGRVISAVAPKNNHFLDFYAEECIQSGRSGAIFVSAIQLEKLKAN